MLEPWIKEARAKAEFPAEGDIYEQEFRNQVGNLINIFNLIN